MGMTFNTNVCNKGMVELVCNIPCVYNWAFMGVNDLTYVLHVSLALDHSCASNVTHFNEAYRQSILQSCTNLTPCQGKPLGENTQR